MLTRLALRADSTWQKEGSLTPSSNISIRNVDSFSGAGRRARHYDGEAKDAPGSQPFAANG
jgi:hypothetical protein